jgi:hypothetical protein
MYNQLYDDLILKIYEKCDPESRIKLHNVKKWSFNALNPFDMIINKNYFDEIKTKHLDWENSFLTIDILYCEPWELDVLKEFNVSEENHLQVVMKLRGL